MTAARIALLANPNGALPRIDVPLAVNGVVVHDPAAHVTASALLVNLPTRHHVASVQREGGALAIRLRGELGRNGAALGDVPVEQLLAVSEPRRLTHRLSFTSRSKPSRAAIGVPRAT